VIQSLEKVGDNRSFTPIASQSRCEANTPRKCFRGDKPAFQLKKTVLRIPVRPAQLKRWPVHRAAAPPPL